jgi:hypothetical protein
MFTIEGAYSSPVYSSIHSNAWHLFHHTTGPDRIKYWMMAVKWTVLILGGGGYGAIFSTY